MIFRSLTAAHLRKNACRNMSELDSGRSGNEMPLEKGKH